MNTDIRYEGAGCFSSRGEWTHPCGQNTTCEYIFMLTGKSAIEENGHIYRISAGDVLRLDGGIPHGGAESGTETVSFFWLHFSGGFDASMLPKHSRPDCRDRLNVLFRQLLHYANAPGFPASAADCMTRLILTELSVDYLRSSRRSGSLYENVCEWCRINWDRKLTVADVAGHFGYNGDYLTRLFKKTGQTGLKEYIAGRRLEKIRSMLLDNIPLKEIAARAGFESYKELLKFFRYHEGVTPTEYRNMFSSTHTNNH